MPKQNKDSTQKIQRRYGRIADEYLANEQSLPNNADGGHPQTPLEGTLLADMLYKSDELASLPAGAAEMSLGCGNPLAIANLQPGQTVLDLGSGGGIDCFLAAEAVGPTGHVIGVDITDQMLEIANRNKARKGLEHVEFRKGRIESLPVASQSIDVVISNCVIDISPDKAAVFAEAFRVLKPGGRLFISDTVIEGEFPPDVKANVDRWAGAVVTPLISHEAFLAYIAAAGFENISVDGRVSYGLENIDALDAESQSTLRAGVDWTAVPSDAGLYSIRISAKKPENSEQQIAH